MGELQPRLRLDEAGVTYRACNTTAETEITTLGRVYAYVLRAHREKLSKDLVPNIQEAGESEEGRVP